MSRQKHIRFDWAIKRLLRQKVNFVVLEGFLTELLGFDVKIQEIIESEGNQAYERDKFNRVDILAKNDKDELILVEVQNEKEHDYFHRMNYAQAKLISDHINLGDEYSKVKKVYSVNIVYFELGQGNDYIYVGKTQFKGLHENDLLKLSDVQKELYSAKEVSDLYANYYIIKTNNFNDISKNTLDEWIYFLKNSEIKDEFKAKGLIEAKEKLRVDNLSNIEKESYDIFIKDQRIRKNEIDSAIIDGLKEKEEEILEKEQKIVEKEQEILKLKQKEQETKIKLAKKMLRYEESIEEIMQETGLSKDEINNL